MLIRRHRARRAQLHALGVNGSRLRLSDLIREAAVAIRRHPARSLMTAVGTVLAAGAFVATLGLGSTMQQQVSSSFDIRRATEVIVRPEDKGIDPAWQEQKALERLRRLNGVAAAGRRVGLGEQMVTRSLGVSGRSVPVLGADSQALAVMQPHVSLGRLHDGFHDRNALRTVLLPRPVAESLSITRVGVAVFIADQAYTVIGIYDDVARRPEAMMSILIPASTADKLAIAGQELERDVLVETAAGAAQLIGEQAPLALRPERPGSLRAIAPPDARTLRREVEDSVTTSSLILSAIALLLGVVSIGNAATAAISARTSEIGLRRAIGGRPAHIFGQLLAETTVLGAFGGSAGAVLGLGVTAGVSLWQGWVPVIDIRGALMATAVGAAAGLVAGLLPATRATRVQPVTALQR